MKIGIVGCGNVGGNLARLFAQAGYDVLLSSRHTANLVDLAKDIGERASIGKPEEVARAADVVVLAIPLGGVPDLSENFRLMLRGKIVMDACNPFVERDGASAKEVFGRGQGTGVWMAEQLPGARVVRAFNTVPAELLETEAHRSGEPIGVPLASDDPQALETVRKLVRELGFGPVIVGELKRAREFDPGTPVFASGETQSRLEKIFGTRAAA